MSTLLTTRPDRLVRTARAVGADISALVAVADPRNGAAADPRIDAQVGIRSCVKRERATRRTWYAQARVNRAEQRIEELGHSWSDTEPVMAGAAPRSTAGRVGTWALLVAALAGDVSQLYLALALVGSGSPAATLLVVVALAVTALGLAHRVGSRIGTVTDGNGGLTIATAVLWAVIGLCAAGVRLAAAPVDDSANALLAGLLLALYAGSGVLAALLGHEANQPQVRCHERRRRLAARRRELADARRDLHFVPLELDLALEALDHRADLLRYHARSVLRTRIAVDPVGVDALSTLPGDRRSVRGPQLVKDTR